MNNQSNKAAQKSNEKYPENKLKNMEICNFNDREFKMALLKKLNEMQENADWQFEEHRNKISEQKEYFPKEIQTLKKNQIEHLERKNSLKEIKNGIACLGNKTDQMEERISDTEDRPWKWCT